MYKSQVFIQFRESYNINKIIKNITQSSEYYKQLDIYINYKAQHFINYHNEYISVRECKIYTMPNLLNYIFAVIYTNTNTNHPYLLYFNLNETIITFIVPFGGDYKQINKINYYYAMLETNYIENIALIILLDKTIYIRKEGIVVSNQFSLINCANITNCIKKMHNIDNMNITLSEKEQLKIQYNKFYLHKAFAFLKYYFDLLDNNDLNNALLFLKGDYSDTSHNNNNNNNNNKYYKKQRINTFFKNTKQIFGHLEIFLSLYELYHASRTHLNEVQH